MSVLPVEATLEEPVLSEPLAPVVLLEPLVAPIVLLLWSALLLEEVEVSFAIEPEVEPLVVAEPLRLPDVDRSVEAVELLLG